MPWDTANKGEIHTTKEARIRTLKSFFMTSLQRKRKAIHISFAPSSWLRANLLPVET
jgi:hypothetical protein